MFFTLVQVILLLVEFLYLQQVESLNLDVGTIASFLGILSGIIGVFELTIQWFVSSRLIDKLGVFISAMLLPGVLLISCFLTLTGLVSSLVGVIIIKFMDEIFRYTILAGIEPTLFQPLPEGIRNLYQARVQGIIQPIAMGVTGLVLWGGTALVSQIGITNEFLLLLLGVIVTSLLWLYSAWQMRSTYVNLLVQSAEQGRLSTSTVDLRAWKQAILQALEQPSNERDHASCIQLLCQIDPLGVGDVLAPLLRKMPPRLQRQSLEAMLHYPQSGYCPQVAELIQQPLPPEILSLALRYLWLTQKDPDPNTLQDYLLPASPATVRATAAALMLRQGTTDQKAVATDILRRMLTHDQEQERIMGCRALREVNYLQALRIYIPGLLQDDSLRVRRALLEIVALLRLEEYYPALVRGLHYKSTREAARQALISMEDEAIPLMRSVATDIHKPDLVRFQAWEVMGGIGTRLAVSTLVEDLLASWGIMRRQILKTLLKVPGEVGIETVLDELGRSGVENLIHQELLLLGQVYAAISDLSGEEMELLRRSLQDTAGDVIDRCFLLMKFLYPATAIQAAAFNLNSNAAANVALGIEILDNTLDLPTKQVLLRVFDRQGVLERIASLQPLLPYQKMSPRDRLHHLLELRHFLPDWCLACCFHGARAARWRINLDAILVCLRHPTGFVREAVLVYLQVASPRTCQALLHHLDQDPDMLVAAQVAQVRQLLRVRNS
jgi:HEAT repeat protein